MKTSTTKIRFSLKAFLLLHAMLLCNTAAYGGQAELAFVRSPMLLPNPNPGVPLAAILKLKANRPVTIIVDIEDVAGKWKIEFGEQHKPELGLPILGMRPDRLHRLTITIRDSGGNEIVSPEILQYTTPLLPAGRFEFPPLKVSISKPAMMEPGVTFLSIRRRPLGRSTFLNVKQRDFTKRWGLILGIDAAGEVVWYYQTNQRISGIERMANGNILYHLHDFRMIEIDMLGNTVNQWYAKGRPQGPVPDGIPLDVDTLHHQPHELPSGDFLAFNAYGREIDNYYTSEVDPDAPRKKQMVMGDKAVIFDRKGNILWEWDSFEFLDPFRIGYDTFEPYWHVRGYPGHADWTHGNGLSYDSGDDSVLVSFRKQDAMIKISRDSGQIKWILGEHTDWPDHLQDKLLRPIGALRWPYHSHNPRVTPAGTIMFFDNALHQARPFHKPSLPPEQTWSRAVEFRIDEDNMTVEQVWASAHELNEDSCNAWAMGDAHRMPVTDNVLVINAMCVPYVAGLGWDEHSMEKRHVEDLAYGARIVEYTHTEPAREVFRMEIADPDDLLQWNAYGGFRAPSLYGDDNRTH